jgi:hypothetical protein
VLWDWRAPRPLFLGVREAGHTSEMGMIIELMMVNGPLPMVGGGLEAAPAIQLKTISVLIVFDCIPFQ